VLTADSGFHSEESVKELLDGGIDAYVADRKFRLRDRAFRNGQEYKKKSKLASGWKRQSVRRIPTYRERIEERRIER
jgi:hypothetical protein